MPSFSPLCILLVLWTVRSQNDDIRDYVNERTRSHCDRVVYAMTDILAGNPQIELYGSIRAADIPTIGRSDHDMIYQVNTVTPIKAGPSIRSLLISWNINSKGPEVMTQLFISQVMEHIEKKWIQYKQNIAKKKGNKNLDFKFAPEAVFFSFQEYGAFKIAKSKRTNIFSFQKYTEIFSWLYDRKYVPTKHLQHYVGHIPGRTVIGALFLLSKPQTHCYPIVPGGHIRNEVVLAHQSLKSGKSAAIVTKGFVYTKTAVTCHSTTGKNVELKYVAAHFPFAGGNNYDNAYGLRVEALEKVYETVGDDSFHGIIFLVGDLNFRNNFVMTSHDELTNLIEQKKCSWEEGEAPRFMATCKRAKMKKGKKNSKKGEKDPDGEDEEENEQKNEDNVDSSDEKIEDYLYKIRLEKLKKQNSKNLENNAAANAQKSAHQNEMNILRREDEKIEKQMRKVNYLKLRAMEAKLKAIKAKELQHRKYYN